MPSSKNIDAFPHNLYVILESVLLTQSPVMIKPDSEKEAKRVRFQIYGLRKAIMESKEHPLKDKAAKITTELVNKEMDEFGNVTRQVLIVQHADQAAGCAINQAAEGLQ